MARKIGRFVPAAPARPFGRLTALSFHRVEDFVRVINVIKKHFRALPLAALSDALMHPKRRHRSVSLIHPGTLDAGLNPYFFCHGSAPVRTNAA